MKNLSCSSYFVQGPKNGFKSSDTCKNFRKELLELQGQLRLYTKMLSDMAEVEDLTNLESTND